VRFVSDRRWKAVIHATGTGSVAVVEIWGDHVSFEGFDVWGGGTDGAQGIDVEGSDVSVVGNHVHDIATPCPPNGNGGAGIVVGGGKAGYRNRGGVVARNLVQGIGTGPRDGSCRLVHGIYAAVPGVTIVNNIVRDALGDGITSWHAARSLTIANNLATENGGVGVLVGSGDSGAPPAGNIRTVVANNIVSRNAMQGITESTDGKHRVGPGNRYLHNLAFQNHGADPDPAWGIRGLFPGAVVSGTVNADPGLGGAPAPCRCMPSAAGPVVDAGTRVAAPRDDFRGAERPKGRAVDIGPYELR
jgi:hypothetical protein